MSNVAAHVLSRNYMRCDRTLAHAHTHTHTHTHTRTRTHTHTPTRNMHFCRVYKHTYTRCSNTRNSISRIAANRFNAGCDVHEHIVTTGCDVAYRSLSFSLLLAAMFTNLNLAYRSTCAVTLRCVQHIPHAVHSSWGTQFVRHTLSLYHSSWGTPLVYTSKCMGWLRCVQQIPHA